VGVNTELQGRDGVDESEELVHHVARVHALGLCSEVQEHAMPEDRPGERTNIGPIDGGAPVQQGAGLSPEDQEL
jgi:hypothetical protein